MSQNHDVMKVFMDMFRKTVKEWARSSEKYQDRNKKRDFNAVMLNMSTFTKRYIGAQKHAEVYDKIISYLVLNNFVIRNNRGMFDVSEARYNEYKE
ncbi:MAG: hypothetical protein IJD16_10585 [Desulfovibrio sp.]|nr:hypothetical protein [Desulfovibrio sp.]